MVPYPMTTDLLSPHATTLNAEDLQRIFERMEDVLAQHRVKLDLVLIGSSILISEGQPGRATCDIDVWKRRQRMEQQWLPRLAEACGLAIDPPHDDTGRPHFSWVNNDFIGYPDYDTWKDDTAVFWQGDHLTLRKPPIGIILGSKIAAGRDKDDQDIQWILDTCPEPEWRASLETYTPLFEKRVQAKLQQNLYYFDMRVQARQQRAKGHKP